MSYRKILMLIGAVIVGLFGSVYAISPDSGSPQPSGLMANTVLALSKKCSCYITLNGVPTQVTQSMPDGGYCPFLNGTLDANGNLLASCEDKAPIPLEGELDK